IRWLDVAMDDAVSVGVAEDLRDLASHADRLADRQRPSPEAGGKVFAIEPLHGEKVDAVTAAPARQVADDARMIEPLEDPGLEDEPLDGLGLDLAEQLDRGAAAGLEVVRRKDQPHPARRDLLD